MGMSGLRLNKKKWSPKEQVMKYIGIFVITFLLFALPGHANNIRIDSVSYNSKLPSGVSRLTMKFTVVWENSWRDDYNYDAAYVFFKFKRKETDTEKAEPWNHLFLSSTGNSLVEGFREDYDFWLAPLSADGTEFNTGVYIFRKGHGTFPKDSVQMNVTWDVENQMLDKQLSADDIRLGKVQVVGHAVEMVYIPRGAYRIGDGVSNKGFRRQAFPLLEEYDVVSKNDSLEASCGDPKLAADRINDNSNNVLSEWSGKEGSSPWWWMIDFGKGKTKRITYFGINGSKYYPNNIPTTFKLEGTVDPEATTPVWVSLWEGPGARNWMIANDAYPVEKALKIETPGDYRAYRLTIEKMNAGYPVVTTIGMTEQDLDDLIDYSVLIDSPVTEKDSMRQLGAGDGSVWMNGTIPATYPNGYSAFYAMKYELSQEQYVGFLNKLTYQQQNGLLGGRLEELQEGDYLFGSKDRADYRNGIILATKISGMPAVFACDLDGNKVGGQKTDGQNVACNYMNIQDMLAYADWACLRPLTEMEYEKMCRAFYPSVPKKRSFAWGTTKLEAPGTVEGLNTDEEIAKAGNANWGGTLGYPLRVGAFARPEGANMETCGAGYWGCMDLSGNLAEIYYNVNNLGLTLIQPESVSGNAAVRSSHHTAHGDGLLSDNGSYNGAATRQWKEEAAMFAIRGGSFASEKHLLRTSDRTWFTGGFETLMQRDSTVTFRLGHTAPTYPEITSWLLTESETDTKDGNANDFFLNTTTYMVRANKPENPQGGVINYIWYSSESGGEMKVIEGETNQDLYFNKYKGNESVAGDKGLNFVFKRKAITPYTDSEQSSQKTVQLITNPFNSALDTFANVNGSLNTYQVESNWDQSIPHRWGFEKPYEGLTIDEQTGVITGISTTMCNVVVTLVCTLYEDIVYKKQVKETSRNYTNATSYSLRLLPGRYKFQCWGAQGGAGGSSMQFVGGKGGYAEGERVVNAAQMFYIYVGGRGNWTTATNKLTWYNGGFNGGGNVYTYGRGGAGGGASDIRTTGGAWNNAASLNSRVIVAGGGGGAGYSYEGGAGGGTNGSNGGGTSAKGGTQTAGGAAHVYSYSWNYVTAGTWGTGGNGSGNGTYGSAGGGGYYGGGGTGFYGGGGGGSGYIGGVTNGKMSNGQRAGNGMVTITILE